MRTVPNRPPWQPAAVNGRCRAVTLIELTVSVSVMAVLMGGLTSAMLLAGHALPEPDSQDSSVTAVAGALDELTGDLFVAQTILSRNATAIQFEVPDRDQPPDGTDETLLYSWSGTAGDPIEFTYNADPAVTLLADVQDFNLTYQTETRSVTTTQAVTTVTNPAVVSYFDGWSGITPTVLETSMGPGNEVSQYFELTPPAGTETLQFTQVRLMMRRIVATSALVTVEIHRSLNDGTFIPDAPVLGTPSVVSGAGFLTSAAWVTIPLDVAVTDFTRNDYCLTVHISGMNEIAIEYLNNGNAPANGTVLRWSTNNGTQWKPTAGKLDENDLRYYLYVTYSSTTDQEVTSDEYRLKTTRIRLTPGSARVGEMATTVHHVARPQVATP